MLDYSGSFDPTETYYYMVHHLPFNLEFNGGDNNDGITILDITDLDRSRYCFVNFIEEKYGNEAPGVPAPLMTPLSASQYLWSYYDEKNATYIEAFGNLAHKFEGLPLVDIHSLANAWPRGDLSIDHEQEQFGTSDHLMIRD
jgi:hypothetical protein